MYRLISIFLLLQLTLCLCYFNNNGPTVKIDDPTFLHKQKNVVELFNYINQFSCYDEFEPISKNFKFEDNWDQWSKPQYAKEFWNYYKTDILPHGKIFSIFYPKHLKQAIALFRTFYYTKDYDTFFKAAVWARQHVNKDMFVYAFSVAVIHSEFTKGILLPPIYEILPNMFFPDQTISKMQKLKQQNYWEVDLGPNEHPELGHGYYHGACPSFDISKCPFPQGFTFDADYTGWTNPNNEDRLAYFMEDVGMNSFYYYYHLHYPFWMNGKEFQLIEDRRGELFYYVHQQLLARYYLERLSNNLGKIPDFNYDHPIKTGYDSHLRYTNGLQFPNRPDYATLHKEDESMNNFTWSITVLKDYERRLRDAIDLEHAYTPNGMVVSYVHKNGLNTLGNLIESNADSINNRYYGDHQLIARHLLGYAYPPSDEYEAVPSVLEHFETSLRDPVFYQLYNKVLHYFYRYQNYLSPYSKAELQFDGIKINKVEISKLETFFEYYYSDIADSVTANKTEFLQESFRARCVQYRLNHKPYNYNLYVQNENNVDKKVFIKVFIGPKYDKYGKAMSIANNRANFVEIDRFHASLEKGLNMINRTDKDSQYQSDLRPFPQLFDDVYEALSGKEVFEYKPASPVWRMPNRFLLPKGKIGGQAYQIYFIVSPARHTELVEKENSNVFETSKGKVDDFYSMGYPLDRPIENEDEFLVKNSFILDVLVEHKEYIKNLRYSKV